MFIISRNAINNLFIANFIAIIINTYGTEKMEKKGSKPE